jgi:hypothetical protein
VKGLRLRLARSRSILQFYARDKASRVFVRFAPSAMSKFVPCKCKKIPAAVQIVLIVD